MMVIVVALLWVLPGPVVPTPLLEGVATRWPPGEFLPGIAVYGRWWLRG